MRSAASHLLNVDRYSLRACERTGSSTSSWTTFACRMRSGIPIWCAPPGNDPLRACTDSCDLETGHGVLMGSHSGPTDGRPQLLHPREHGPVRPAPESSRRHTTTRRRDEARCVFRGSSQNAFCDSSAICCSEQTAHHRFAGDAQRPASSDRVTCFIVQEERSGGRCTISSGSATQRSVCVSPPCCKNPGTPFS